MLRKKSNSFNALIIMALSVIYFVSCARNPVTGKNEFMLLSENDEIRMGAAADKDVVQMYGLYDDQEILNYVDGIGQKMAKISHRPQLKYEFKVMNSPVINAFAVPGGYIYITRGILAYLNNEAELAGVIGHEIGHVTARHSAQKYTEVSLAQLGLGVGTMISPEFAQFSGLAAQGIGLLFLKFSRDDERQSDELGVAYSTRVGYDAREMANFFHTLDKMRGKTEQGSIPDWFSTHPNPADRVVDVRNMAEEVQKEKNLSGLKINRDQYLDKINGLIYGNNPREGFVENDMFYHPDMKFQFPVPSGWKVNNLPSQVQIISSEENAIIIFTLGSTNSASSSADAFLKQTKASVAQRNNVQVNGLKAVQIYSQMADGKNVLRIQSHFIERKNQVFVFHGFTNNSLFDTFRPTFTASASGFKALTDRNILNIQPDRLKIQKVSRKGSLKETLKKWGVVDAELDELALINGMSLSDQVQPNTYIKTVAKGRKNK
jgi:predicted Zn-dependent protease